jgi:nitrate/TMAO reductase-like tetraheme cytochrome c subunit
MINFYSSKIDTKIHRYKCNYTNAVKVCISCSTMNDITYMVIEQPVHTHYHDSRLNIDGTYSFYCT